MSNLIGCSVISQSDFDKINPDDTYSDHVYIIKETAEEKVLYNGKFCTFKELDIKGKIDQAPYQVFGLTVNEHKFHR